MSCGIFLLPKIMPSYHFWYADNQKKYGRVPNLVCTAILSKFLFFHYNVPAFFSLLYAARI
jgi:hypothetical protein